MNILRLATLQREPHYRSGPKSLSIKGLSGRIGRLRLTELSDTVHSQHEFHPVVDFSFITRPSRSVAALFDVDNTLVPGEACEVRFFRFLWKRGIVGWGEGRRSAAWLLRHVPPFSLHPLRERKLYLTGKRSTEIEVLAQEFCRTEMIGGVSRQGRRQLDLHQKAGHQLILVTGAPEFLIKPLAVALNVPTVFAAKLEEQDCVYTGRVIPPLPYGTGKRDLIVAHATKKGLDLTQSFAYGDSPGDHEVLALVGHPLVVNPIRGMARLARRQGWPLADWTAR